MDTLRRSSAFSNSRWAVARAKQDGDVCRLSRTPHAGDPIAHGRVANQPDDFVGGAFGGLRHALADDDSERRLVLGRRARLGKVQLKLDPTTVCVLMRGVRLHPE